MNIRIYNARILTMDGGCEIIHGELGIRDDKIVYIAADKEADRQVKPRWDREIDAANDLVMPGFKNAHTHSAMTFLRSYADDLPLQEWLNDRVFPMEAGLTAEHIFWFTKLAIMEYLTSGITANFDMYFHPEMIAQAAIDTGYRTVILNWLNNFVLSPGQIETDYLKYRDYHERISSYLGFHAEYTCTEDLLKEVAALAHRHEAPIFTHLAETERETRECAERHGGLTPLKYLDSLGMFDYGGALYHGIWLDDEEIGLAKEKGLSVVTNPGSNTKLASGICRTTDLLAAGVPMAIGTDGPASNNCLDFFREMFLVTGLGKLREKDAAAVPAEKVLEMATVGGAHAMGLTDCDCLAAGKQADLIMIDLHQPNMQPEHNIVKNLVYSGSKQNVKMTMIAGKVLYEDGRYDIGVAPEEVYDRVNALIKRDF